MTHFHYYTATAKMKLIGMKHFPYTDYTATFDVGSHESHSTAMAQAASIANDLAGDIVELEVKETP